MSRTRRPSPTEAERLAEVHLVDRYDHAQLTALDRLDQLDRAGTPLVVPFHTSRVYRTEPSRQPHRATVAGPEFRVTRDIVLDLLNLRLVYTADVVRIDSDPHDGRPDEQRGEQRTAYVLTATRHGRDVLDTARRIGRLPQ
jgi:hypothetical protein